MKFRTWSIKDRVNSVKAALNGIKLIIIEEVNIKIQIIAALIAITLGACMHISTTRWAILIMMIGVVLALEAVNCYAERLCDLYSEEDNPKIKAIKDIAAASVLIASITAAIVGLIIFFL